MTDPLIRYLQDQRNSVARGFFKRRVLLLLLAWCAGATVLAFFGIRYQLRQLDELADRESAYALENLARVLSSGVAAAPDPASALARLRAGIDLGADGRIVLQPRAAIAQQSAQVQERHYRHADTDGVERIVAWHEVPGTPLAVTVGQSVRDAHLRFGAEQSWVLRAGFSRWLTLSFLGWAVLVYADNRKRAIAGWESAEARWRLALKAAGDGVWDWDLRTRTIDLSPRAQAILGHSSPQLRADDGDLDRTIHGADRAVVRRALDEHFSGRAPDYVVEFRVSQPGQEWQWVLARGMLVERDAAGQPARMVGTLTNIDQRKHKEEDMAHQATHDALTGLANRAALDDAVRAAADSAGPDERFALIYFDLDGFKPVNDRYGHPTGDTLLKLVAARVTTGLRKDSLFARVGGDEFVILLPGCGRTAALRVGEGILQALAEPFVLDQRVLQVGASIGIALFPDDGRDAARLVEQADSAMYEAKMGGRGKVICYTARSAQ
ncbi:MAG: diguanylate cyclase domain-containing protein [Telluria sp.]